MAARLAAALSEDGSGKGGDGAVVAVGDKGSKGSGGDNSLTLPLLILLAQQRKAVAATTSSPHVKLIAELYDKTHETCLQYVEFLRRSLSPRALAAALAPAPLGAASSEFGVDAPVAFDAWRSLLPLVSPAAVEAAVQRSGDAAEREEDEAKEEKKKKAEEKEAKKAASAASAEKANGAAEEGEAPKEPENAAAAAADEDDGKEEGEEGELEDAQEEGETTLTPAGPAALMAEAEAAAGENNTGGGAVVAAAAPLSARAAAEAKVRELLSPLLPLADSSSGGGSSSSGSGTKHLVPFPTLIAEATAMQPPSTWRALTPQLYSAFWRLQLGDLVVPEEAYAVERRRAVAEGAQAKRRLADVERDKAAKERAAASWRGGGGMITQGAWGMQQQTYQMQQQGQQLAASPEELRALDEDARALRLDVSRASDAVARLDEELAGRRRHVAAVLAAVEAEALVLDFSSDPSGRVAAAPRAPSPSGSSASKDTIGWLGGVRGRVAASATVEAFVERCALPRLLHSPGDAAYVAAFVEVLLQQRLRLPGFSTLLYYDRVMKEVVGGALLSATDREAGNLGIFLRHTLRALER